MTPKRILQKTKQKTSLVTTVSTTIGAAAIVLSMAAIGFNIYDQAFSPISHPGRVIRSSNCEIVTEKYCCRLKDELGNPTPRDWKYSVSTYNVTGTNDIMVKKTCYCSSGSCRLAQ